MSRGNGSGLEEGKYGTSDTINHFQGETGGHGLDSSKLDHENEGGIDSGIEGGAGNNGSGMNSGTKGSSLGMKGSNISLRGYKSLYIFLWDTIFYLELTFFLGSLDNHVNISKQETEIWDKILKHENLLKQLADLRNNND